MENTVLNVLGFFLSCEKNLNACISHMNIKLSFLKDKLKENVDLLETMDEI